MKKSEVKLVKIIRDVDLEQSICIGVLKVKSKFLNGNLIAVI